MRPSLRIAPISFAAIAAIGLAGCTVNGSGASNAQLTSPTTGGANAVATSTNQVQNKATTAGLTRNRAINAKIALLVPLSKSGQTGAIAKGLKQAGELALFEFKDPSLQLIVKDTQGTPEGAKAAAEAALGSGAEIIIGPLFATSVTAVAAVAKPRGVPIVAFSNNERVAAPGVYLLSFQARQEIERVVAFAALQGKTRFAGLVSDDPFGRLVAEKFKTAVQKSSGQVAALETYPAGANGMLEKAQSLFERIGAARTSDTTAAAVPTTPVDALFLPGDAASLPTLGPILKYGQVDAKQLTIIGTGGWDYRGVGRVEALRGGLFAAPDPRSWRAFATKFTGTFGSAPPRIASLAYDGVAIAATLAANTSGGQRFSADKMTATGGFTGVDGPVRFMPSGLTERGLAILKVTEYGKQVVEPAPTSFAARRGSLANAGQANANGASSIAGIFQQ